MVLDPGDSAPWRIGGTDTLSPQQMKGPEDSKKLGHNANCSFPWGSESAG